MLGGGGQIARSAYTMEDGIATTDGDDEIVSSPDRFHGTTSSLGLGESCLGRRRYRNSVDNVTGYRKFASPLSRELFCEHLLHLGFLFLL